MIESSRQLAQRILEEQGYLIICQKAENPPPPSVIDSIRGDWRGERVPGPMLVLGEATRQEWEAQELRYGGPWARHLDLRFYKVIAE